MAKKTPNAALENNKITTTDGNFSSCFVAPIERMVPWLGCFFLDNIKDDTSAVAIEKAAIWNMILYVTSRLCNKKDPTNGPIMSPATKNAINLEIDLTLFSGLDDSEIMDSHGGQKNECAIPTRVLKIITCGTEFVIDSRYIDTASRANPIDKRNPLLNLPSRRPTKTGINMYGIKLENPIMPRSK